MVPVAGLAEVLAPGQAEEAVGCSGPGGWAGRGPGCWLAAGGGCCCHLLIDPGPGPGTKFLGERQGAAVSSAPG